MAKRYSVTSGVLARRADVSVPTVTRYADLGLLDHIRASDGTRLFLLGQESTVRRIRAARLAVRLRRKSSTAQARP